MITSEATVTNESGKRHYAHSSLYERSGDKPSLPHQLILKRCVLDEARIADAASSLGLTTGSAKSSLYRARCSVSDLFKRRGLVKRRNLQTMRTR